MIKCEPLLVSGTIKPSVAVKQVDDDEYEVEIDSLTDIEWTVTNTTDKSVKLIFRSLSVQANEDGINTQNIIQTNRLSLQRVLPIIQSKSSYTFTQTVVFPAPFTTKIHAHVEMITKPKEVVKRGKYEAPDIVIEEVGTVVWGRNAFQISAVQ